MKHTNKAPVHTAEIITIGDELLGGQTADTNFIHLAKRLRDFGVRVVRHVTVGDGEDEIVTALREAVRREKLIIVTGGLGVTPDDRTRAALARLAGVPLVPDHELLREIEVFFRDRKIRMPSLNIAQALLPKGARKIANRVGLAPGIRMEVRGSLLFSFPGVPVELHALTEDGIVPFLKSRNGELPSLERELRTWGRGETRVAEILKELEEGEPRLSISYLPEDRGVTIRFKSGGRPRTSRFDPESFREDLDRWSDSAADLLGDAVYSTRREELEEVVGYLLVLYRKTVAVAESCTGGKIAAYLTSVPGSSAYFRGGFVPYHAETKISSFGISPEIISEKGTVSEEVARGLAEGAREQTGADFGIGLTGIAGPDSVEDKPVGLVYCALATSKETAVFEWNVIGNRARIRDRAARSALNLLRLHLIRGGGR